MVSVIVPIYNVENYVKKCLDSLAAQTLEDVEFILIDDGSTDKSGNIVDQYSFDSRFRIFHTENRGLSAARNYGIDHSCGEFLMFVDGDDWVAPDFCRAPYETAIINNADLVIFQRYRVIKKRIKKNNKATDNIPGGIVDNYTAIKCGSDAVWNKIYKRELFAMIRYPEGRVFEDLATTYKLVYIAKRIVMINKYLYYYVARKGSITNTKSGIYVADHFIAAKQKYEAMVLYGYPEDDQTLLLWIGAIKYLVRKKPCNKELYLQALKIIDSIKGIPKQMSVKQKMALATWKIDKRIFLLLCKVTGKLEKQ